jgi:hypothetical protein
VLDVGDLMNFVPEIVELEVRKLLLILRKLLRAKLREQ